MKKVKTIYKFLLIAVITITPPLFAGNAGAEPSAGQKTAQLRAMIENRPGFDREKAAILAGLVEEVAATGFPVDYIIDRIREGITKRANYAVIHRVVKKYSANIALAGKVLEGFEQKLTTEQKNYYTQYITELLGRSIKEKDLDALRSTLMAKGFGIEEALNSADLLAKLRQGKVPGHYAMDVIETGINRGYSLNKIERAGQLFLDSLRSCLTPEETRDILVEGMKNGESLLSINDGIKELDRSLSRERRNQGNKMNQLREEIRDSNKLIERKGLYENRNR